MGHDVFGSHSARDKRPGKGSGARLIVILAAVALLPFTIIAAIFVGYRTSSPAPPDAQASSPPQTLSTPPLFPRQPATVPPPIVPDASATAAPVDPFDVAVPALPPLKALPTDTPIYSATDERKLLSLASQFDPQHPLFVTVVGIKGDIIRLDWGDDVAFLRCSFSLIIPNSVRAECVAKLNFIYRHSDQARISVEGIIVNDRGSPAIEIQSPEQISPAP